MSLSITNAWNETIAFVKREGRLLFPIAFIFIALPGAILQMVMPTPAAPGQPPEAGLWLVMMPLAIVISLVGTLAIVHLALRPGASVGEALQLGARRFLPMLGAILLIFLAGFLLALPLFVLIGATAQTGAVPAIGGVAALGMLILMLAYVFFWVRLMLITAVGAVEETGPIRIITRSWELTRGHFWRLLGFMLLILLAAIVVMFAVTAVAGIIIMLVAGPPGPDSATMYLLLVVSALIQAVISTIFAVLTARIYAQLAGTGTPEVFS